MRTATSAAALAALALLTPLLADTARADGPNAYVVSPIVEEGERELELKTGSAKLRDGSRINKTALAFGYGVTSWWATEFYAIWHKQPGEKTSFDAWEWEQRFQLTETGKYPVDLGFIFEIERPKDRAEGYELTWGPLLQAELSSDWLANFNLLLTKHVRAAEPSPAQLSYQAQLKYRWQPALEVGLQALGSVGPWQHWAASGEQSHIAGPALFGQFKLGEHQKIKYNAGLLFGLNHGAPKRTLRAQAELEF